MLKRLTLILLTVFACINARALTVTVDGINYDIASQNAVVGQNPNASGDITIPETITYDGVEYTVTEIGWCAFQDCKNLTNISLPKTITTIVGNAFQNCSSLQSIGDLPALTTIGRYAFNSCISLQSVGNLPSLTTIQGNAFQGCSSLQSFGHMPKLETIGSEAFENSVISELHFGTSLKNVDMSSFADYMVVYIEGSVPPVFKGREAIGYIIVVPEGCAEVYRKALPDTPAYRIIEGNTTFDVTVSAKDNDSDVLRKINEGADRDVTLNIVTLKIRGTINSYDIMVIRNKMLNLRYLDLSEATIVANAYEYYTGCHTEDNVIGDNMFRELNIREIVLPESIIRIGGYAFYGCHNLSAINLSGGLQSIGEFAFYTCDRLEKVVIPPLVSVIPTLCFYSCYNLKSVSLPPTLKTIGSNAFYHCNSLTEFRIPAGVTEIKDFAIPYSVKDVYTYTIQPTSIDQNTFSLDTYKNATLHVPETSNYLYYWDTQWSQFVSIENFNEPYTYFYLADKDLVEDEDTPRIEGEKDPETGETKNPDAELGKDSGIVVDGDNSQNLGNVDLEHDGNGNGATIIGGDSNTSGSGGNVNIDLLKIKIPVVGNKWYFFAFPFDIELQNIKFNGQMVWRYYDGEWRAMHGSGSWKNVKDGKLERGRGYIFQGSKNGTLTLSIPKAVFDAKNYRQLLEQYVSEFAQDASWNFIGNPFQSYYELADLGFDGPITWWNPDTRSYEAFSPLDDDLSMYPFMAFFVQKPAGVDGVDFFSEYRETGNQKNDPNRKHKARQRRAARRTNADPEQARMLVTLAVTDGNGSDRTRVVFNNNAAATYEVGVDASKFVSTDAPQIYSIDAENTRYAINERPAADGTVKLGFYAPASGIYTIECTRNDCTVTLTDCETGTTVELSEGKTYSFNAEKGFDDTRFVLNGKGAGFTGINDAAIDGTDADATYYQINGVRTDSSARGIVIEVNGNEATTVIRR